MIVGDDMGYADIGVHGSKDIPTPNIDALARAGIRFTDAYVTGPHCSPTRAGLLTGRYQQRFGHEVNMGAVPFPDGGLPTSETTMADRLKAAGIEPRLFGKWHLGSAGRFHPLSRGFDEFFGFLGGEHSYFESSPNGMNPLLRGPDASRRERLPDRRADRSGRGVHQAREVAAVLPLSRVQRRPYADARAREVPGEIQWNR